MISFSKSLTFLPIFNNSLKKGMIYILEEDFPSNIYIYFLRYYIGSNYHMEQNSMIYEGGISEWKSLIPVKLDSKEESEDSKKNENVDYFSKAFMIKFLFF